MDWFLYEQELRHERVHSNAGITKRVFRTQSGIHEGAFLHKQLTAFSVQCDHL